MYGYNETTPDGRFAPGAIICREHLYPCEHGIDRSTDLCVICDDDVYPLAEQIEARR